MMSQMMMINNIKRNALNALLLFYLFFDVYSYILGTGAMGVDTTGSAPVEVKILKYIIWCTCLLLLIPLKQKVSDMSHIDLCVLVMLLFIFLQRFFLLLVNTEYKDTDFFLLLIVFPALCYGISRFKINWNVIDKIFFVSFWFSTIYDLVQFILAYNMIKFPANSYLTGSIFTMRFGGNWNAANNWGVFLSFYLIFFQRRYFGLRRLFYLGLVIIQLILTMSVTGVIAATATYGIWLIISPKDRSVKLNTILVVVPILAFFIANIYINMDDIILAIENFNEIKSGSVEQHMDTWSVDSIDIYNYLGLYGNYEFTEVGMLMMMKSGGIPLCICFYCIGFISITKFFKMAWNRRVDTKTSSLFSGALGYQIALMLSTLNLPLMNRDSTGGLFYFFVILALSINVGEKNVIKQHSNL